MPTYQYQCDACGEPLEVVQSFSDDALTVCPKCNAPELRKVYGSVGVVFKGSGFYRTDSRSSNAATTPAASGTPSTSAPSTPSTSTPASTPKAPTSSSTPAAK